MYQFVSLFGSHSPLYDRLNQRAAAYAAEKGIQYRWAPLTPFDRADAIALLQESDAGFIGVEPYDASIFAGIHKRCRLLIRFGVGFDNVNLPDATKYGICAARTSGANAPAVAEMALTMILALRRQLEINRRVVKSGVWTPNVGVEMLGKTVGIVGFGAIGQILAKLFSGFGCRILAYDPYPDKRMAQELGVALVPLPELTQAADAISIHVPYRAETHHLFDARLIAMMKPDAVLVCTARGNIVDEDALYTALTEHKIAGAGLDVFAREPLPVSSPLIGLDNVVLTPHAASQTTGSLWAIYQRAIDIADDFFAGRPLAKTDLLNPDYVRFLPGTGR